MMLLLLCLAWLGLARAGAAQERAETTGPPIVVEIAYTGDVPVSLDVIPSRVPALVGKPYSPYEVRKAVEYLYGTGLFAQVMAYRIDVPDGVRLRFHLRDQMRVRQITFNGNRALKSSQLRLALRLTEQMEYAPQLVARDVRRLTEAYRDNGYLRASVTDEVTTIQKQVDITYRIREGTRARFGVVRFDGAHAIPESDLRAAIRSKASAFYSRDALDRIVQAVRNLYRQRGYLNALATVSSTEYVADRNEMNVRLAIEEGRRIDVRFVGNRVVKDQVLRRLLSLERTNEFAFQAARENLEEFYRRRGFFKARVEGPALQTAQDAVVVEFTVREGKRYFIEEVRIDGNSAFSDSDLLAQMKTRPRGAMGGIPLLRRFSHSGVFDPAVFEEDKRVLEVLYRRAGYANVRISGRASIEDGDRLVVTVTIDEGVRWVIHDIVIAGDSGVSEAAIRKRLASRRDDAYDAERVAGDRVRIRDLLAAHGYPYAEVTTDFDPERGRLTFRIDAGKRVTIGRISVQFENANPKTHTNVIRRELLLKEGDPFDTTKLMRSRRRIFNLGFFNSVRIDTPGFFEGQDTLDIQVIVRERNAGSANVSGGYSPSQGARATLEVVQRNWMGTGRRIGATLRLGTLGNRYELTFVEPWTLGTPTRTTLRAFRDNLEEQDDILTQGGMVNLSRTVFTNNRIALQYRVQQFATTGHRAVLSLEEFGIQRTLSAVGFSFFRDTRDNLFNPTRGWVQQVRLEVAGGVLGGRSRFTKVTTDTRRYARIEENAIFATQMRLGLSSRLGPTSGISSTERFRLGGSTTVRGYEERSLGRQDAFGNYRGNILFLVNAELRLQLRGAFGVTLFADMGNLWNDFDEIPRDLPKIAIGGGLRVETPIGPVRVDIGLPLARLRGAIRKPRTWVALGNAF